MANDNYIQPSMNAAIGDGVWKRLNSNRKKSIFHAVWQIVMEANEIKTKTNIRAILWSGFNAFHLSHHHCEWSVDRLIQWSSRVYWPFLRRLNAAAPCLRLRNIIGYRTHKTMFSLSLSLLAIEWFKRSWEKSIENNHNYACCTQAIHCIKLIVQFSMFNCTKSITSGMLNWRIKWNWTLFLVFCTVFPTLFLSRCKFCCCFFLRKIGIPLTFPYTVRIAFFHMFSFSSELQSLKCVNDMLHVCLFVCVSTEVAHTIKFIHTTQYTVQWR